MRDIELIIVEDDPIYQGIYAESIRGIDVHMSFCGTVSLAVSLFSLITPDAIIVDLGLPDGDGVDAIKEIINSSVAVAPYIIVATSSTDASHHQRAIEAGANKVMVKPIDDQALKETLLALAR